MLEDSVQQRVEACVLPMLVQRYGTRCWTLRTTTTAQSIYTMMYGTLRQPIGELLYPFGKRVPVHSVGRVNYSEVINVLR